MPTSNTESFVFDNDKRLRYKRTEITTDGSGAITATSVFRAVYDPSTAIASLPASVQAQAQIEWTQTIQSSWSGKRESILNPFLPPEQ